MSANYYNWAEDAVEKHTRSTLEWIDEMRLPRSADSEYAFVNKLIDSVLEEEFDNDGASLYDWKFLHRNVRRLATDEWDKCVLKGGAGEA